MLHEVHPLGFTPRQFENLLVQLGRRYTFARLDEVCAVLRTGREIERDTVVLTFDDGLRNNCTYASPLLARHRAKATFFVVPGLIANREWLWTHEILTRLWKTPADRLSRLRDLRRWATVPGDAPARLTWARQIVDAMKGFGESERSRVIEALRDSAPTLLDHDPLQERYALMDWDEIRRLDTELIEIGSHSYSHTILDGLPADRLEQEITASRDVLAAETNRVIGSFCYPDGRFDAGALDLVRRSYAQAVTTADEPPDRGIDLHRLPRTYVTDNGNTLFRIARSQYVSGRRNGS